MIPTCYVFINTPTTTTTINTFATADHKYSHCPKMDLPFYSQDHDLAVAKKKNLFYLEFSSTVMNLYLSHYHIYVQIEEISRIAQ